MMQVDPNYWFSILNVTKCIPYLSTRVQQKAYFFLVVIRNSIEITSIA